MSGFYSGSRDRDCEKLKSDNRYLQDELAREREYRELEQSRMERERRESRERQRRDYQEALSTAYSWEEAFSKALQKIAAEVRIEDENNFALIDDPSLTYAHSTWAADFEREVVAARDIYQNKMKSVYQQILNETAEEFEKLFPQHTTGLAEALREDNFSHLVEW